MSRPGVVNVQVVGRTTVLMVLLLAFLSFSGAHAAAVPAGDFPDGMRFGGLQRTYLVHVPPGLEQPAGLVINLHGAGMTGGAQAAMTNYNAVADQHGFVVAYPEGIDLSWADGRGAAVPDRQGVDDVGFLVAIADRLTKDFGIDPGRVFATGMSAGAFMANRLACSRADVFSAVATVAGTLGSAFPCNPSQPVSVLSIHGTADNVVPFNGGPMVGRGGPSDIVSAPALAQEWRELDGCPAPVEDSPAPSIRRFTAAGCVGGTEVSFVQIDGGGHTWMDASNASGQFFATHGR
ncbi:poly(3-hydroxybutyrate) depolymerase [Mycolicibacterium rhodesiae NBB3]|uniref:Poly(3-hydroxybutyrate) depolymerase n=1 Tax=Mycolicibacterium rhodesiae (strain NBB3) TaxID=710685 RepID=G8RVY2_MYCRN|nr:PHB depolymerase family esterase [Mycolicibacterium rhodesiae]AEV76751.1 poly(3-hydroxybutyrate) depolymerase [Mycolicibacterium rhodesiae NBB3]